MIKACILSSISEEEKRRLAEEEFMLMHTHSSIIDPESVSDEALPLRLAKCAEHLQSHQCNDSCLVRKLTSRQLQSLSFDPTKDTLEDVSEEIRGLIVKCRKDFPKRVPDGVGELAAHVLKTYKKCIMYFPPRDHPFVNNYHPIFLHLWAANIDLQILHGKGM